MLKPIFNKIPKDEEFDSKQCEVQEKIPIASKRFIYYNLED